MTNEVATLWPILDFQPICNVLDFKFITNFHSFQIVFITIGTTINRFPLEIFGVKKNAPTEVRYVDK